MHNQIESYRPRTRLGSTMFLFWISLVAVSSIAFGGLLGWIVGVAASMELSLIAILLLAFIPGLWAGQMGRWMKLPNPWVLAFGGLLAGLLGAYFYLALRIAGLYSYEIIPLRVSDVVALWPSVEGDWVEIDRYTGKETPAYTSDIYLLLLGFWSALILSLIGNPIAAYMRAGWFEPFCNACDRWIDEPVHTLTFELAEDIKAMVRQIKQAQAVDFASLVPTSEDELLRLEFRVYQCSGCNGPFTLSVRQYAYSGQPDNPQQKKMLLKHQPVDDELIVNLLAQSQTD